MNYTLIKYVSQKIAIVEFDEPHTYQLPVPVTDIKSDRVKNPLLPRICGVGYRGIGLANTKHPAYKQWLMMLDRCYTGKTESYDDTTVCDEWHDFQNYAVWYDKTYKDGHHLDKDIKVPGNKVYSPDACLWVPRKINTLFINFNTNLKAHHKHRNRYRTDISIGGKHVRKSFKTKAEARGYYFKLRAKYVWSEIKKLNLEDKNLLILCRQRCSEMLQHGKQLMATTTQ